MSATPYAGLRKKLVAVDDVEMGGVCEVTVYRNPDGPEAAEAISSLLKLLGQASRYVADHQEAQPNDETRALLAKIDAALNSDASTQTVKD
jgi:hypothetical protein